jgi:hypothetical protein
MAQESEVGRGSYGAVSLRTRGSDTTAVKKVALARGRSPCSSR